MRIPPLALALALLAPAAAHAQHGGAAAPDVHAPAEARQYDFLVGQWSIIVTPKVSSLVAMVHGTPKLHGTWKAWRALDGWGVEDELRIVDEAGNPHALAQAVRLYDAAARRWLVTTIDPYRARVGQSTARWQGGEMVGTSSGTDGDGRAYVSRTHLAAITPSSFRFVQDVSYDGGANWEDGHLVIEATRVAATAAR